MSALQPHQYSILIVEDEALIRTCAVIQLEDAGFAVIEATDGEDGLRLLAEHPEVTIVFSDINMPGRFDGLSLAHQISQLRPSVRVILTSGRAAPQRGEMPSGASFLSKPYDSRALTALIQAA